MKLERVSLETACLLKEKGFDLNTDYLYFQGKLSKEKEIQNTNWNAVGECHVSAPPIALVVDWLREKHNHHVISIKSFLHEENYYPVINYVSFLDRQYKEYYQALESGVNEVLTKQIKL